MLMAPLTPMFNAHLQVLPHKIYLKQQQREMEKQMETDLLSAGSLSKCLQLPGTGPNQSQKPCTHPGLPYGQQGPRYLGYHLLPSKVHQQEAGSEVEWLGLEPALHMGCSHPKRQLNSLDLKASPYIVHSQWSLKEDTILCVRKSTTNEIITHHWEGIYRTRKNKSPKNVQQCL